MAKRKVTFRTVPRIPIQALVILRDDVVKSPVALKAALRRDFLHIIDCLRPLIVDGQDHAPRILQWWTEMGTMIGVKEGDLRAEAAAERQLVMGSDVAGCSWFKCVRHEQESDNMLFYRCAGCDRAVYCGSLCQGR